MKNALRFLRLAWLPAMLLALALAACNVNETKEQEVFSFPTLADSLKNYDYAVILLQDEAGKTIDTLYNGPISAGMNLTGLQAPHYTGGKAVVLIGAYKSGTLVYQIERKYDGATGVADAAVPVILPSASLSLADLVLKTKVGDTASLPAIQLSPANLSMKQILWSSTDPTVVRVDQKGYRTLKIGFALLRVQLGTDGSKSDSVRMEVSARDTLIAPSIDSLRLSPETLQVAENGAAVRFKVAFYPANAPSEIIYGSLDSSVATVNATGWVRGLKAAFTRIFVRSLASAGISDTAWVQVLPKVSVDSIRFKSKMIEVFQQGAAESLLVQAYPPLASQEADFLVRNPLIAKVTGGKVLGLLEGDTWVVANSLDNAAKIDSTHVFVLPVTQVDSVTVKPDTLRLYWNGESLPLKANIYPATLQARFNWRSSAPAVAAVDQTGKVAPQAIGYAFVTAISRADSSKRDSALVLVRKDTPRLSVGPDTTFSVGKSVVFKPVAPQDYGLITRFKWDLNGDGAYEDSAADLKEVSFTYSTAGDFPAKFYVRDTEGNDTAVVRNIKAVTGLIVQITSPKDGFITNQTSLDIAWSVDGAAKSDKENLVEGVNTVTRSAKDAAGTVFTANIKITLDTKPPKAPTVKGPLGPISTHYPSWTWSPGGEGSGTYRLRIDSPDMSLSKTQPDTFFTADSALIEGAHTLFVQERDAAGNWSPSGQYAVRIDATPPANPNVTVLPASPTLNRRPVWSWTGSPAEGIAQYRYKLDNNDMRIGAIATTATTFQPNADAPLAEGTHILYVQQSDSAGNWSTSGSKGIVVDLTGPLPPKVTSPASPTNVRRPAWTYVAGGGGNGTFRYKLDDRNLDAGATETNITTYTPDVDLIEGTHTLYVQERDTAGNWSPSDSGKVSINLSGPTAPKVTGTRSSTNTASWSWTGTGRVSARYTLVLTKTGEAGTKDSLVQTSLSYQPRAAVILTAGTWKLKVREEDNLGNWGAYGEADIVLTKPGKPAFDLAATSPKDHGNGNMQWTWTAGSNGGGGYELTMNGGAPFTVNALQYTQVGTEGQSYTLSIRTVDGSGIKGDTIQCYPVKIDLTAPTLAFTTPMESQLVSSNPTIVGTASDPGGGSGLASVTYSAPGATPSTGSATLNGANWTLNSTGFPVGFTTVSFTVTDKAGLKTSKDFTLIRNVVFVKAGSSGNGTNWSKPYGTFESALAPAKLSTYPSGTQIWVTEGNYNRPTGDGALRLRSNLEIYGGFNNLNMETTTQARNTESNRTTLNSDGSELMGVYDDGGNGFDNVKIDAVNFYCDGCVTGISMYNSTHVTMTNCDFSSLQTETMMTVYNTDVTFKDCDFYGSSGASEVLRATGVGTPTPRRTVTVIGGSFSQNTTSYLLFISEENAVFQNVNISSNTGDGHPLYWLASTTTSFTGGTLEGWNASPSPFYVGDATVTVNGTVIPNTP